MGILSCKSKKNDDIEKDSDEKINPSFVLKIEKENEVIPNNITLKIYICGIKEENLMMKNIFSKKINDIKDQSKSDMEFQESQLYWLIKLCSEELNENIFDEICKEIENDRNNLDIDIKQNTVIYFEDNPEESDKKDIFLKKIEELGYVYRPRMIFITRKKSEFKFRDKRYITNIVWNDDSINGKTNLFNQLISTIWNIDCYFNERYNECANFSLDNPDNIFKGIETNFSDYSINILLTGLSRAGKSSFINLMTEKLSALESNDKESVTSKLTEYFIYTNDKNNEYCGTIKLIDSPGLVYNFNDEVLNKKIVLDSIREQLNKAIKDKSINQVDIVLFFFREGENLENAITVLQLLNEKNFKVIFVINHSIDTEENGENKEIISTISFLKSYKLNNLTEKENFIPCNLKSSRKFQFYGMKEIWERIYNILNKINPFITDDFGKKIEKLFKKKDVEENMDLDKKKKR